VISQNQIGETSREPKESISLNEKNNLVGEF